MKNSYLNRRRFLKQALACSVAGSGALAVNGKLGLIGSALAQSSSVADDYRALVCVFLYGGADSFNLFMPGDETLFNAYQSSRGQLALQRGRLRASGSGSLMMHPAMSRLQARYDAGQLAVVGNVGNLVEPVTRQQIASGSAQIPADLFAHNHQQEQWQKAYASEPAALVGAGWGGRMADLLDEVNNGSALPPVYSMNGSNYFSAGIRTTPVAVSPRYGVRSLPYLDTESSINNRGREQAMADILALPSSHLLKQLAGERFQRARDNSALLGSVLASNAPSSLDFNTVSDLGPQLRMVARLIAGRAATGQRRQIYFVGMGGWDTHDSQTPRLNELAADLDLGLDSFQQELDTLGVADQVTTFTASDFGRTLTVNGDGSDHGWGGHYLTLGGMVSGNQFVGQWPSYEVAGIDDTGDKGRVIPSLSVNQYGASLASWMGLSVSEIHTIFPDLSRFDEGWQQQYGLFRA